jgi:hypothetical protein
MKTKKWSWESVEIVLHLNDASHNFLKLIIRRRPLPGYREGLLQMFHRSNRTRVHDGFAEKFFKMWHSGLVCSNWFECIRIHICKCY